MNLAHHPTHVVMDLGCTRLDRDQQQKISENMHGIMTLQRNSAAKQIFRVCQFRETCKEGCIVHFPTTPTCSTTVDLLETGDVRILFSLPQMRNLGTTVELDLQGDKITCPAFGLFSSSAEYSTLAHNVLDLTSLTHQPTTKSSNRSGYSKETCNLCHVRAKTSISGSCSGHA